MLRKIKHVCGLKKKHPDGLRMLYKNLIRKCLEGVGEGGMQRRGGRLVLENCSHFLNQIERGNLTEIIAAFEFLKMVMYEINGLFH